MLDKLKRFIKPKLILCILLGSLTVTLTGCSLSSTLGKITAFSPETYQGNWVGNSGSGYFMLNKDNTYRWYKDSSKNENNVSVGNWSVTEVKNYGGEGYPTILLSQNYIVMDGKKHDDEKSKYKTELVIEKYTKDRMLIYNTRTQNQYEIMRP